MNGDDAGFDVKDDSEFDVKQVLPRDRIPSVDDPEYAAEYPDDPEDDVIAVELTPDARDDPVARAYPIRYLHFHEIVNDELGGVPIAVTWCPLCGSAVVYDRRVEVGSEAGSDDEDDDPGGSETRVLEFGVSGKLADDDLVMYDRETGSEWKQSLGVAIDGPLEGTELTVLPAATTTWAAFRDAYPDGDVLAAPGGESEAGSDDDETVPIDYDAAPYEAYFETDGFGLAAHRGEGGREWDREDLDPKTVVLGIERDGDAVGFPLPLVAGDAHGAGDGDRGMVTASVGGEPVVVFATPDGIHAFENPGYEWGLAPGGFRATRADGSGALYEGSTGRPVDAPAAHSGEAGGYAADPLARVAARRLFAFAWQDDHGPDAFFER